MAAVKALETAREIAIGGASGYWGDAAHAVRQLLDSGEIDYLVFDYLAEITMSILARARAKDPTLGYAGDFPTLLAPHLPEIAARGIRVVANAGGVNPQACGAALRALAAQNGVDLKVAVVLGDDLADRAEAFAAARVEEMFSGAAFPAPEKIASINAYLGAFPIAAALAQGADIVVTGRCVDSAVTLGACIHAFDWTPEDHDRLSAGSLAGHLLECGPQASGGNFTDWREAGDIAEIGYPIARIRADGDFILTKPEGTSGVVNPLSVGEQMLYEIGDPQAYLLPDVVCDFADVTLTQVERDAVLVSGARGAAPTGSYKVSATFADGWRAGALLEVAGFEARAKAEAYGRAALERARKRLRAMNAPDFEETSVEVMGGATGDAEGFEEAVFSVAARHQDPRAIGLLLKETTGLALATAPGMTVFTAAGRPKPSPVVRLFSFLTPKAELAISIDFGEGPRAFQSPPQVESNKRPARAAAPPAPDFGPGPSVEVPLIRLAAARSGDKGDKANIGVLARRPEYLPFIWAALTEEAVATRFARFSPGAVQRFHLPGSHSMNILIDSVLGGGGVASLRVDAQGKSYGQMLLAHPIPVPERLLADRSAP